MTAAAIVAAGVAGCGTTASQHASRRPLTATLTSGQVSTLRGYGQADMSLGLSMLGAICRPQPSANAVLSPVSIATGLGMVYLGAEGGTATAMGRLLQVPQGPVFAAGLRDRAALLHSLNGPGLTFSASNRVWASATFGIRPAFQSALWTAYQAGLQRVPFLTVLQQAIQTINAAVSADTHGHVPALLSPTGLLPPPSLLVTDALFLDAAWARPFDHGAIAHGPFQAAGGKVTASYLTGPGFGTATSAGWTAAALPYRGGRLDMLALLPPPGNGCQLPQPAALSALGARAAQNGAAPQAIALPEVNLTASESLRTVLTGLGLGAVFTPAADFKGISAQACCLGNVLHEATLQVTAAGTVASAATGVSVQPGAVPPPRQVLRFDRPYLLALIDTQTSEPLMLAWVANPAAG